MRGRLAQRNRPFTATMVMTIQARNLGNQRPPFRDRPNTLRYSNLRSCHEDAEPHTSAHKGFMQSPHSGKLHSKLQLTYI